MHSQSPLSSTNYLQLYKGSIKGGGSTLLATSLLSSSPVCVWFDVCSSPGILNVFFVLGVM